MLRFACLLMVALVAVPALGDEIPAPVSFREHVAPILVRKCLGCHNSKKAESGLNMATFAALRKGGKEGGDLILEPGDPDSSQLIELVQPGGAPRMPYKLPPLSRREIETLERWVKDGARFDGPSETETPIASLVDPLRDLPKVAVKAAVAEAVNSMTYSPDGKNLAAGIGPNVVLFETATGKPVATLEGRSGPVTAVRITPDGRTLVAAGGRPGMFGSIAVWDLEARKRRFEVRGHADAIQGVAIAPDGKSLATAGYDRLVKLWSLGDGKELRTLTEHTDAVYAVAFAPGGNMLASAGADRTVKLWDLTTGRRLKTLSDATAELYAVAYGPGGETVLAAGVDRSIHAWRVGEKDASLVTSVFAHDGAIVRLAVSADGKTLASSGEDRYVKVWDLPALKPRAALMIQSDWPQGLAISPDGTKLAVGRHDGSLSVHESSTGKPVMAIQPVPPVVAAAKPGLLKNATLNPPSPRGAAVGTKLRMTLSGNAVGRAVAVLFDDPAVKVTIVPAKKPDPNRLEVDVEIDRHARIGIHRVGVVTPLGVPATQPFAVSAYPEAAETEPNDAPDAPKVKLVELPGTVLGTIERPGDVDHFRFRARAGEQLVFQVQTRSIGSKLQPILTVLDEKDALVDEGSGLGGTGEPVLTVDVPRDGLYSLKVADADYAGSGAHFYRISAGATPYLASVFPLGVEHGSSATVAVAGRNLGGTESVTVAASGAAPGAMLAVLMPAAGPGPVNRRTVVVAEGAQTVEAEDNDSPANATPVAAPGGASGRIAKAGDVDVYRFEAKKGQPVIVEVFGRRLGTPIDPVLEILSAQGARIPRAVLRPVDQTEVAFRDHDSSKPGIRLTRWNNLAIDDYVLIGRELARIKALPRNPDDDCAFWSERNVRLGFLETTPEHHPEGQPIYKVAIHPPGTVFPAGGVPPVTLYYRNDDGGPDFSADSRVTFDPPADGAYLVRVEDVRGLGGDDFGYHLVVRPAQPDFRLAVDVEDPDVPRGGTTLVTARIARLDGFDGPVDVTVDGLPPGVAATGARIEAGEFTASVALSADATAPAFSPPSWRLTGRAVEPDSAAAARELVHGLDPGGPAGGRITVTPAANLAIEAGPKRLSIRPGQQVSMELRLTRGAAFAGRVPIEIRNLPKGVRVQNVGLNGVLITEKERERTIFLQAEPWVGPLERPFYAVGKAEAAGTEHSSPPIFLVVEPAAPMQAAAAAR